MKNKIISDVVDSIYVDNEEYFVYVWSSSKALKWVRRCQEFLLKPLAAGLGSNISSVMDGNLSSLNIDLERGVNTFLESLDENNYVNYMKDLFVGVVHGNSEINFETHFKRKMLHMHKLAYKILEYQLADFFEGARGAASQFLSPVTKSESVE
ncbi:phage tail assembly chaperone [Fluviispira vulneris]|uniref:phage tail assembly chaperone n=1 Tax=Fluviispira vulneris TaxID=2763012 RepID=UPI0016446EC4|nr:hypothetical protein [Fluviispira vulneris]